MKYKTAIVTGGTSGIGLSIVKYLAKTDYNVYYIGTRIEVGKKIEKELALSSNGQIKFVCLDLSDLKATRQFITAFNESHNGLNLLVNCAGVLFSQKQQNKEGIEKTFAISYLSAYILSNGLSPLLQRVLGSRIINVSTTPKKVLNTSIDFDTIDVLSNYNAMDVSLKSVHAKTALTQVLARQFQGLGIRVNSFDPGMVKSALTRNMPVLFRLMYRVFSVFMDKETTVGIRACTAKELSHVTGKLITKNGETPIAFDETYLNQLIDYTKKILIESS